MGNRSNIVIRETATQTDNCLILYSHWGGDDNLKAVRNVMAKTDRVGDNYLAAQIFHEFTTLGNYDGGLGFGAWVGSVEDIDEYDNPAIFLDIDTGATTYKGETYTLQEKHLVKNNATL
jgi:hypothetical protein